MNTVRETVEINASDGLMGGAVFRPIDSTPCPAVIMTHGAPGLDAGTLQMAEDLAGEGFVVLAPDMFYRTGSMQVMQPDWSIEQRSELQQGMTSTGDIVDVGHMVRYLHQQPHVADGGVGITGFCMGGRVSYLTAARVQGIGAAVMYYPTGLVLPDKRTPGSRTPVAMAAEIKAPIIGFLPTLDLRHASPGIIAEISAAFAAANVDGEIIPVEGANHGFIDPLGHVYDPVEGPKAWVRMVAFFRANL